MARYPQQVFNIKQDSNIDSQVTASQGITAMVKHHSKGRRRLIFSRLLFLAIDIVKDLR